MSERGCLGIGETWQPDSREIRGAASQPAGSVGPELAKAYNDRRPLTADPRGAG